MDLWHVAMVAIVGSIVTAIVLRGAEMASLRVGPLSFKERALMDRISALEHALNASKMKIAELETLVQFLLGELQASASTESGAQEPEHQRALLLAVGQDQSLHIDLAAFRKVQARTGLRFYRLMDVTMDRFERFLERARAAGRPIKYVHISAHMGPDGAEFADGIATGLWLSEQMKDVQVAVLDGCESEWIGDLLGVVPFVITLMEEIEHHDAMLLAEIFWLEIARGAEPETAFYTTLDRCPPAVAEFAQLHT